MNPSPIEDPSTKRIWTICLITLTALASTYTVYWLRPMLIPLVVAVFVVSGVSPILMTLENRLGVNRLVAAALTFLAGVLLLGIFGISIWASMVDLAENSDAYRARVRELVAQVESRFPIELIPADVDEEDVDQEDVDDSNVDDSDVDDSDGDDAIAETRANPDSGTDPGAREAGSADDAPPEQESADGVLDVADSGQPGINGGSGVASPSPTTPKSEAHRQFIDSMVLQGISIVTQSLISMVSTSVVVLIYVFFMLIGTPTGHRSDTFREIDLQIRSYLALKTIISIFTGAAFGFALRLFGVPMSFTFGVMAFLLNFVPNIGPLVASLLPIPLILLDPSGSITWMATTIIVICTIQLVSGNFVEPKIMGDSADLHPVTILLALMFWGMMWGIIGMFLATPITAALKIVLERLDQTRPLASLMAGRWDLQDDDPDEEDQAFPEFKV